MTISRKIVLLFVATLVAITIFAAPGLNAATKTGDPIKIGIIGPMNMRTGVHMFITAEMAAEKINDAGGIKIGNTTHPVELVKIHSNEFKSPADAVAAAERAITVDKVDFLIGGIVDEAVSAIQDIAADYKTIYISASYSVSSYHKERVTENYGRYKYCFTTAASEAADLAKVHFGILDTVAKAIRKKGIDRVKVAKLIEKSSGGDRLFAAASKVIPHMGMEIVGNWRPSPAASNLRAETAAIKKSAAHIIYTVFSGPGGMVFGKQLEELKIPALVAGSPAASLFPESGIPYSVTMMSPYSISSKITDKNQAFYKEFLERSGGELCVAPCNDRILSLASVIEEVGSLDPDKLVKAMESHKHYGVGGLTKYDPKDHRTVYLEGYEPVYGVQQLPDGEGIIVWPEDSKVDVHPVQIPQWMLDAWKEEK